MASNLQAMASNLVAPWLLVASIVFSFEPSPREALKPTDTLARRFVYRCRAVPGDAVGLTVAVDSLEARPH